jgi:HNH endonuclease
MLDQVLINRFWGGLDVRGDDECWVWTKSLDTPGYGQLRIPGPRSVNKRIRISRLSWIIHNGPIPDGMNVLHRCDNPPCANPRHLFLGDRGVNMRDMVSKGRHGMARKTHCIAGHEFTEENTMRVKGGRSCRECARRRSREWYHRTRSTTENFI